MWGPKEYGLTLFLAAEGRPVLSLEDFPPSVNVFHSPFGVFHALSTVAFSSSLSFVYQSAQSASSDQNEWSGILYV